ncbi:hypothetical protein MAPG_07815 [Magnaporthiopsis poae ATCC 64411]|uniref:Uncharacterized protein n=1 Tax=Magnaporthiopsis poae (strain ATCC 64411 / 73-15) TaxID=644358 RepID=A0A0C4E5P1_MAGP6|nr:hypothetical protein MAPG_07815 [Magnaporthiopsis poae ATCC 64411]
MASYTINEPHPTVPQNSYVHSGRGGAGNIFRVSSATTPAAGIPTKAASTNTSSTSASHFYSGRGGAGNAHQASERIPMSFDAEYADAARHASASSGYVGRGGAGNVYSPVAAAPDASAARRNSASTDGSEKSGFWGRLSGSYRR